MKISRNTVLAFLMIVIVAALYRIIPARPQGFAPHMAMALFGGAVIANKKWAFALPLLSLFLSDLLYQLLHLAGISPIAGFYGGQWQVYLLFCGLTCFGFLMKKINFKNVALFSVSGSVLFFLASNFMVWLGGGGFQRPKTFQGLMQCYGDALVFYRDGGLIHGFAGNFIIGDMFFCALFFGGFYLLRNIFNKPAVA